MAKCSISQRQRPPGMPRSTCIRFSQCLLFVVLVASISGIEGESRGHNLSDGRRPFTTSETGRHPFRLPSPSPKQRNVTRRRDASPIAADVSSAAAAATVPPLGEESLRARKNAVALGILLAWNSGYLNGCCLSGSIGGAKHAVAAVTGAYTSSALGLASGNMSLVKSQLRVLASFIGGSFIAGILNPQPELFAVSSSCGHTFLIGSAVLVVASLWAFKAPLSTGFICLVALANGIQNSISSAHTANLCRSTHFSGLSSDIGTFLGQVVRGNRQNLFKLQVFMALATSFWTGGFCSFFASRKMASASLLVGAIVYGMIGCGVLRHQHLQTNRGDEYRGPLIPQQPLQQQPQPQVVPLVPGMDTVAYGTRPGEVYSISYTNNTIHSC